MTIQAQELQSADWKPTLAIALRVTSAGGLAVQYSGIRRFLVDEEGLAPIIKQLSGPNAGWRGPKFGKMKTALTICVENPVTALIFVLDNSLNAEFSATLPAIFAADERSNTALANLETWPEKDDRGGPRIATVVLNLTVLKDDGDIGFNLGLDNVGTVGPDRQTYRTPIVIDPDVPYPPTHGGVGGGGPP